MERNSNSTAGGTRARASTRASALVSSACRRKLGAEPCAAAPPQASEIALGARASQPPPLSPCADARSYERLLHTYGKSYPETVRAFATSPTRPISSPCRRPNPRSRPCSTGRAAQSRRHPVRRRLVGRGRRRARRRPWLCRRGQPRHAAPEPRAGSGPDQPRRVHSGRRPRSRDRSGAQAAWLRLRHYPQSFEFSTLGGWIATRSGGHFATLYTHIDDLVESLRTVTPAGVMESRACRAPVRARPDRMMIGSEGASASSPRRGCGSKGGRASAPTRCRLPRFPRRRARRARRLAGRSLSVNPRVIDNHEAGTYRVNAYEESLLVLAFNPPTIPWTRGSSAPSSSWPITAGGATPTRRQASAGAPPSSACPTRAS